MVWLLRVLRSRRLVLLGLFRLLWLLCLSWMLFALLGCLKLRFRLLVFIGSLLVLVLLGLLLLLWVLLRVGFLRILKFCLRLFIDG